MFSELSGRSDNMRYTVFYDFLRKFELLRAFYENILTYTVPEGAKQFDDYDYVLADFKRATN